jgi:hypothetical protein
MSNPKPGGQVAPREGFATHTGTPEVANPLYRANNNYMSGGQVMMLSARPSPQVFTQSQGGRIHVEDPTYSQPPTYGQPPIYGLPPICDQPPMYGQEDPTYGVFPPLGGGQGRGCPQDGMLQDKLLSPQQLQDQLKLGVWEVPESGPGLSESGIGDQGREKLKVGERGGGVLVAVAVGGHGTV